MTYTIRYYGIIYIYAMFQYILEHIASYITISENITSIYEIY